MYEGEDKARKEMQVISNKVKEIEQDFTKKMAAHFSQKKMVSDSIHEFFDMLIERFNQKDKKAIMKKAVVYGKNTGEMALKHGIKLDETINRISTIRREMWNEMKKIMLEEQVSLETALETADHFDPLFDKVIYALSTAYIDSYKENLDRAEEEFLKLSAPIVTIMERVAVLPIIGGIDGNRAEILMDKALKAAAERELSKLFIDLSAVTLIDTMVAYHIYKIVQSLDLVGVSTVLVGIRPEVTQTMVGLGVEFAEINTYGSLQQALSKQITFNH
ncbi:STAS domain-containing protein [Virgibacillus sp. YIM 98842]|uniref:STAS domain-containing protein n=1 Tax=Virgibacillus sp. YIM 98842 TaxID=2663533 RepID=UPI0013DC4E46|nr:STAS domain-containing protein [Virgibacillus sp. YIM 98842]